MYFVWVIVVVVVSFNVVVVNYVVEVFMVVDCCCYRINCFIWCFFVVMIGYWLSNDVWVFMVFFVKVVIDL